MATAAHLGWKGKRLHQVNEAWKRMAVLTWSEIANLDGTKIAPACWKAHRQPALRNYEWLQTAELTSVQLREWRKLMTTVQQL